MERSEIDFQANETEIAYRPRRLRWVLWGLMIFCALMIGLVVLSQARITTRAQSDPARLSGLISAPHTSTESMVAFARPVETADAAANESTPAAASRPLVSAMPTNRVPVRRAGISVGN